MLRFLISSALKVRFALWAIELALPRGADLKQRFRSVLLGVVAAVAGGVLCAACFIAMIIAAGAALHTFAYYSVLQSAMIMMAIVIVFILVLLAYGSMKLKEAFRAFDESRSFKFPQGEDKIQELLNGFIEGLVVDKPPEFTDASRTKKAA